MDLDTNDNELMGKLNGPLFKKASALRAKREIHDYGVTFHPHVLSMFNRKSYNKYTHDQQRAMLLRIEASCRKQYPEIELQELQFEVGPKSGQIHFHAHYKMPPTFATEMRNYYQRYATQYSKEDYEHFDIKLLNNIEQWQLYIRKAQ